MFATSRFSIAMITSIQLALGILFALHALLTLTRTPERLRGSLKFLVGSWLVLALSSTAAILSIWMDFRILLTGGPTGISYRNVYSENIESSRTALALSRIMALSSIVCCDALMLRRCDLLWRTKRWVIIFPAMTLISATGVMISTEVRAATAKDGRTGSDVGSASSAVWVALSIATNVMVTSLILFKLIRTSIEVSRAFPTQKPDPMYRSVATIIIESALPLTIFGLCFAILISIIYSRQPRKLLEKARISIAGDTMICLYQASVALSPQLILYRVITGRSWKNAAESQTGGSIYSQPIRFAVAEDLESKVDPRETKFN